MHLVVGGSQKYESYFFQRIEPQLSANLLCSHAQAALAPVETTDSCTDRHESIAGRRKVHNCTDDSMLDVHVSRGNLENIEE